MFSCNLHLVEHYSHVVALHDQQVQAPELLHQYRLGFHQHRNGFSTVIIMKKNKNQSGMTASMTITCSAG
jgi:hypothetical protein